MTEHPTGEHSPSDEGSKSSSNQRSEQSARSKRGRERRQAGRRVGFDRRMPEKQFAPDEYVFREGEKANLCYQVVSGRVGIFKQAQGEQKEIVEFKEGDIFGEMALIDNSPRRASAKAKEVTVLKQIHQRAFLDYLSQSPEVSMSIMKRLIAYARSSMDAFDTDAVSLAEKLDEDLTEQEPHESYMLKLAMGSPDNKEIIDEFQHPADSLIRRRIPPVIRWAFATIFLVFSAFVLWATLSTIDVTLSVQGKLSTSVPSVPVQAGDTSVVRSIHVELGESVKKGEILATLDPTLVESDLKQMQLEIAPLASEIARLKLEKSTNVSLDSGSRLPPLVQSTFRYRIEEHISQRRLLDLAIQRAKSMIDTSSAKYSLAQLNLDEAKLQFSKKRRLVKEGILNRKAIEEAEFSVKKAKNELKNAEIALNVAKSNHSTALTDKQSYLHSRLKQINKELTIASQRYEVLKEDVVKMEYRQRNVHVIAPVDGIVLELDNLFEGAVVSPGDILITLVPTNVPLTVEMDVKPQDISNIVLGNEVSVKLSALPYQKHGDLAAELTYLSEDTVHKSINGESGTFFRARAIITSNNLRQLPPNFRLFPGIQVQSDIRVAKRRLITYFLYPVIRTLETSFVEP